MARALPPKDPGLRLRLLLRFHLTACDLLRHPMPENHVRGGRCWNLLAIVDEDAGDFDALILDLRGKTAEAHADALESEMRVDRLERALDRANLAVFSETFGSKVIPGEVVGPLRRIEAPRGG